MSEVLQPAERIIQTLEARGGDSKISANVFREVYYSGQYYFVSSEGASITIDEDPARVGKAIGAVYLDGDRLRVCAHFPNDSNPEIAGVELDRVIGGLREDPSIIDKSGQRALNALREKGLKSIGLLELSVSAFDRRNILTLGYPGVFKDTLDSHDDAQLLASSYLKYLEGISWGQVEGLPVN